MKPTARIAVLSALLAITSAFQAQAARNIQTDQFSWQTCSATCGYFTDTAASGPLSSMGFNPSDSQNPLGLGPSALETFDPTLWAISYMTPEFLPANQSLPDNAISALRVTSTDGDSQFQYYFFGNGNWSVQFNYDSIDDAPFYAFPTNGAVFDFEGSLFEASFDDLVSSANLSNRYDFSSRNGVLSVASYWHLVTPPTANVPEPGVLALLVGALGLCFAIRRPMKGSTLLQSA